MSEAVSVKCARPQRDPNSQRLGVEANRRKWARITPRRTGFETVNTKHNRALGSSVSYLNPYCCALMRARPRKAPASIPVLGTVTFLLWIPHRSCSPLVLCQEAVNFVRLSLSENNGDLSGAAKELTKLALDEGSVDNISAVLVWFEDKVPQATAGQQQHQQQQRQHPHQQHSHTPPGAVPRPRVAPD